MKVFLLTILGFSFHFLAASQSNSNLFLTVIGQHYGYPLEGANVELMLPRKSDTLILKGTTDDKGLIKFIGIEPGVYTYSVEFESLYRASWKLTVKKGKTSEQSISVDDSQPFRKRVLEELVIDESVIDSVQAMVDVKDTASYKPARYRKGLEEMNHTLDQNTNPPFFARVNNITGKVKIKVLIDERGSVKGLYVAETPNITLNFNALWAVSQLKEWRPATFQGKPVPSIVELPVNF
jgi:hypothetical protein